LKRARTVLLAAAGRSTRSIAKVVGVQPRIVNFWRPGKQPIYSKATDKRMLKLLDEPPPQEFVRWTGAGWGADDIDDVRSLLALGLACHEVNLVAAQEPRPKPPMLSA
jgi:hypothetical protein